MRLISFAIVSLLAITVSAYPVSDAPHQSTTTQSALQHQSTGTPGAQPPRSALAQKKLASRAMQRRLKELEGVASALDEGSPEQNEVIATLSSRITDTEKARKALDIERKELKEIRDEYNDTRQKLDKLNGTRQMINGIQR
ncbi:hypothetical protein BASA60_009831 [Batrachochytrium salamandrivorans]|nr:hypothetical protein BASA60_009831 [Batrachochytrium salamandrivorans]